jgi:hypothetical protein
MLCLFVLLKLFQQQSGFYITSTNVLENSKAGGHMRRGASVINPIIFIVGYVLSKATSIKGIFCIENICCFFSHLYLLHC